VIAASKGLGGGGGGKPGKRKRGGLLDERITFSPQDEWRGRLSQKSSAFISTTKHRQEKESRVGVKRGGGERKVPARKTSSPKSEITKRGGWLDM